MDIIKQIEQGLGKDRLQKLKRNDDNYQIFWLGVLEHRSCVDKSRDPVPYLISCGYGAIANARLQENTRTKVRVCERCGRQYSYRYSHCPHCLSENETVPRVLSMTADDGSDVEFMASGDEDKKTLEMDIARFVDTLYGNEKYVAKRWLIDRADLRYDNHCKQLALELGCSAPYVAAVKKSIREKWKLIYR